jgi:predicted DNA-binding transcriptional regulator AlpA
VGYITIGFAADPEGFKMIAEQKAEQTAPPAVPALLDGVRAARYVGLSKTGWYRAKSVVGFPKPVRVEGSGLRWRRVDLDAWVSGMRPARG